MKKWTQRSSRIIHEDRWISLRADECLLPNGTIIEPYYVLKEKNWVHVVAFNASGEVLVTEQYRYATDSVCLEIPCGCIEDGESPLEAAKRELKEETGVEANAWGLVFSPFANPARQTNRIFVFVARELTLTGELNLDISEEIQHQFMLIGSLMNEIRNGRFSQALHVSSFLASLQFQDDVEPDAALNHSPAARSE